MGSSLDDAVAFAAQAGLCSSAQAWGRAQDLGDAPAEAAHRGAALRRRFDAIDQQEFSHDDLSDLQPVGRPIGVGRQSRARELRPGRRQVVVAGGHGPAHALR